MCNKTYYLIKYKKTVRVLDDFNRAPQAACSKVGYMFTNTASADF